MPNETEQLSNIMFADDTNFFISGKSLTDLEPIINNELSLIHKWLINNRLSINLGKTKYMIMSAPNKRLSDEDINIEINGTTLECVEEIKFLGVLIDHNLTWKYHIEYVSRKISKGIGILYRAKNKLSMDSLLSIYNTLIKPYFTYCLIIWGNTYKTYLDKLFLLQKKVVRIITRSTHRAHTAELFKRIQIMPLHNLYRYFVGIFVYKSVNNSLPDVFSHIFIHNQTARNSINLRPGHTTKRITTFSVRITGPKIWNILPVAIKTSVSHHVFKKALKRELLK